MISRVLSAAAGNAVARLILALLLFAGSLGGFAAAAYADQYINGGIARGASIPPVANPVDNPLGVNLFLEKEVDPSKVEKTLQMTHDAGIKWVRQVFAWNDIEISGKGNYTDTRSGTPVDAWAKYDRIVDLSQKYGVEIIARLDSPPVWARIPGDDVETYRKGPPNHYSDYADFVRAVVTRYKGKIKYFQIWNEPNLYGEWGGHPVNPREYTDLLKQAYQAAKGANPDAVVITAALAPTAEKSQANLDDVLFLEGMYEAGAGAYFDILSTMLYGLGQSPDERRTDLNRLNFSRPILLHNVMERYGDGKKPIWISEYGWVSLPTEVSADPSKTVGGPITAEQLAQMGQKNIWGKSVDEATQAQWLVEGYERIRKEWPWLGAVCIWHMRVPDPVAGEPANYFALLHDDFSPRPAYTAIKDYSKRFPSADTGTYPPGGPTATVASIKAGTSGAAQVYTATLRFGGSNLSMALCKLCVVSSVSLDGGTAKKVHVAGSADASTLNVLGGLNGSVHTAVLTIDSPDGSAPFTTFTVWQAAPVLDMLGFPVLYGLFLLLAVSSGAYSLLNVSRWVSAALDIPRNRYAAPVRELARNAAALLGIALLTGLYMKTESLPLLAVSVLGLGLIAYLKPTAMLAAVVAAIPFFWYPKDIGTQHFPLAETLLLISFGALMARRITVDLLPGFAGRLNFPDAPAGRVRRVLVKPTLSLSRASVHVSRSSSTGLAAAESHVPKSAPHPTALLSQSDLDELLPARWPRRPMTTTLESPRVQVGRVEPPPRSLSSNLDTSPLPILREDGAHPITTSKLHDRDLSGGHDVKKTAPLMIPSFAQDLTLSGVLERFRAWNRTDLFGPPALALLLAGCIAMLTLADPSYAKDSARAFRWVIVEPVLFYFVLTEVLRTRRAVWRLADIFVATAVCISFIGIGQYLGNTGTLVVEGVSRVFGVYQHPNNLALYLGRVLPFALCIGIFLPWGWRKSLYLLAAVPIAFTTFLTFSRGAYIAVAVAVIVAVIVGLRTRPRRTLAPKVRKDRWVLWTSIGMVAAGVLLIVGTVLLPRIPERYYTLGSGVLRVELWQSSLRMLRDHIVFGVGPDQFLNQFQAHYITPSQEKESFTAHPHNLFLDYWLTLGIMGVPILLWLLWKFFREAAGKAKRMTLAWSRDPAGRAIAIGLVAGMVDFFVHGTVDNSYFLMDLAMIFWLSCGLLQVLGKEKDTAQRQ